MDTDELSSEAYSAIIIEAEKFNHDLTLQFGILAASCENENEYLHKAKKIIKEIKNLDKSSFSEIFFDFVPDKKHLLLILRKIILNISKMEKIPLDKRHYEF